MSDPQQPPLPPYVSPAGRQPGHPAQSSTAAQPYYQSQPQQPAHPGASGRNTPGRVGFIFGLLGLGLSLVSGIVVQLTINSDNFFLISLFASIGVVLVFCAALAALISGIVGLRRLDAPHGQAGIAVGLGIAGVASGVVSFLVGTLSMFIR
ncbi:hypothetical protein [Microbacterium sp. A93]|uniref:hypothetical protein n=1 Tax=Microbacterium sp. A93 TaxID=3450716 RepID=UPI003F433506